MIKNSSLALLMIAMPILTFADPIASFLFSGNTIDVSGNGNTCTNTGAILTVDRFGNENSAYYFDGTDDYMQIDPVSTQFGRMENYSISLWYQFDDWEWEDNIAGDVAERYYLFCGHTGANDSEDFSLQGSSIVLDRLDDNTQLAGAFTLWSSTSRIAGEKEYLPSAEWTHVCFVRSGGEISLFVDGVEIEMDYYHSKTFDGALNMMHELYIGAFAGNHPKYIANGYNFKGSIDDLQIWDSALSEIQIKTLSDDRYPETTQITTSAGSAIAYPNPTSGLVSVAGASQLELINNAGILIKSVAAASMDISGVATGYYSIIAKVDGEKIQSKLLVK